MKEKVTRVIAPLEVLTFTRYRMKAPFKVIAWHGRGKRPEWLLRIQKYLYASNHGCEVRGWTTNGKMMRHKDGVFYRAWYKGEYVVTMINESEDIFQGGEAWAFAAEKHRDLLEFCKDMGINQDRILVNVPAVQTNLYVEEKESDRQITMYHKRGTKAW